MNNNEMPSSEKERKEIAYARALNAAMEYLTIRGIKPVHDVDEKPAEVDESGMEYPRDEEDMVYSLDQILTELDRLAHDEKDEEAQQLKSDVLETLSERRV